jgi:hypothetical protein
MFIAPSRFISAASSWHSSVSINPNTILTKIVTSKIFSAESWFTSPVSHPEQDSSSTLNYMGMVIIEFS